MKKHLPIICAALLMAAPVAAKTTPAAAPAAATVPVGSSATPVSSATPLALTTPVSSAAPAPAAAEEDTAPTGSRPADLSPSKVIAADLTLTSMNAVLKGGEIDFTMNVKNNGKAPDKMIGFSTDAWPGTSAALADGKTGNIDIPAGDKADIHLIIKGATSAQIRSGELPITFYFGRGPNTHLKVYLSGHQGIGSKIMGIFK